MSAADLAAMSIVSAKQSPIDKPCPHIKGTVKWGIAASRKWCDICKKWVQLEIDWSGHP